MRRNFFAAEAGRPVSFFFTYMAKRTLSIFVDESGRFQYPDELSRFYILSLVLHDQANDLSQLFREFDAEIAKLNLSNLCFHAGPIVRQEKGYVFLNRELRARCTTTAASRASRTFCTPRFRASSSIRSSSRSRCARTATGSSRSRI